MRIRFAAATIAGLVAISLCGCTQSSVSAQGARQCRIANIGFDPDTSIVDGQTVRHTLMDVQFYGFKNEDVTGVRLDIYDITGAHAITGKKGSQVLLPVGHRVRITQKFMLDGDESVTCDSLTVRIPVKLTAPTPSAQEA